MTRFRAFSRSADAFEIRDCATKDVFLSLQAKLRRNGCAWIAVKTIDGHCVFHARFTGNRQTAAQRDRWISPREMLLAAQAAIGDLGKRPGSQPVTASRDVPKPEGWTRGKSTAVLYAKTSVTVREMNRRLAIKGCAHQILTGKKFAADLLPSICGDGLSLSSFSFFNTRANISSSVESEADWWPKRGVLSMGIAVPPGG